MPITKQELQPPSRRRTHRWLEQLCLQNPFRQIFFGSTLTVVWFVTTGATANLGLSDNGAGGQVTKLSTPQLPPTAWFAAVAAACMACVALTRKAARQFPPQPKIPRSAADAREGVSTSITEALRHAKEAAEAANRAKDDFIASLSHELRSPLNPVLLLASEYARSQGLPAQMREDFQVILKNVRLQARLIDDLLDLTRIERGGLSISARVLHLDTVLREVYESLRSEAAEKHIQITLDLPTRCYSVRGDNVRLQQVFGNILRNAIKFSPPHSQVQVRLTASKSNARVSITDHGSGILQSDLKRIFEPFTQGFRGDAPVAAQGLGLGLSIARRLVERHRGVITAESDGHGMGATFRVELPLETKEPELPPALSDPPPPAPQACLRILLVDDHESTRQILARMIRRLGHQVFVAGDLRSASEVLSQNLIDILISDLGLPDGEGTELTMRWKHKLQLGAIALSGFGMASDVTRSLESGFSCHLTKPVEFECLAGAIEKICLKADPDGKASG